MRRIAIALLGAILLLARPLAAQPTPSCPGDCNLDGSVGIDELLRAVNFLLDGTAPVGCEELDDNRDGHVGINEVILAVGESLTGCRLSGEAAAEAAEGGLLGTANAFQAIALGSAATGGSAGAGATATTLGVSGPAKCGRAGTMARTCTTDNGVARETITFDRCLVALSDLASTLTDGTIVRTVRDAAFCDGGVIPDGVLLTEAVRNYSVALIEGGRTTAAFAGTYERRFIPSGAGCAGRTGTEVLDGSLSSRCGGTKAVACPVAGRDLSLVARDLTVVLDDASIPGQICTQVSTLTGRLELRDHISGEAFDAVYRKFLVRSRATATGQMLDLSGAMALDCLGELTVESEAPLVLANDARCPSAGALFVRLPDDRVYAVQYVDGGVDLDLDGDGKTETHADSCEDPALAQCR